MSLYDEYNWSKTIEIFDVELGPDCLNRARYAYFLTNYLNTQKKDKSYVLNINAGWGTGKSFFLKRWTYELKKQHPVIYIDAWKNDHASSPLASVTSNIITQLRELTDKAELGALSKVQALSSRLINDIAPIVVGSVVKKMTGVAISELDFKNSSGETSSIDSSALDKVAQKVTASLISEHEKRTSSILSIKNTMQEWIGAVIGQNNEEGKSLKHPTFIIIDELDRCRPNYAVEVLEVVKHIFDIPNVVFVIATDTEQLQHAIKAIYGQDFDASNYLSRFFNARFTLPPCSLEQLISSHDDIGELSHQNILENDVDIWPAGVSNVKNICSVFDAFNIPARNAIQILERIISIVKFLNKEKGRVDIIYLTTLLCFQIKYHDAYSTLTRGVKDQDFSEFSKKYAELRSSNKLQFAVYFDRSEEKYIHEEINLSSYYERVFQLHSQAFVLDSKPIILASLYRQVKSDMDLYNVAREKFNKITHDDRNSSYEKEVVDISYNRYSMYSMKMSKYIDLVELAILFD